jgi:hypothetical protein
VFAIRKGATVQEVSAPAIKPGVWTTVHVVKEGSLATLVVDGKTVAENQEMTLQPDRVCATQCYLGRGLKGNWFGGKIDRFVIQSVPLLDRTPPTPDPAVFEPRPQVISPSAVALSAARGTDPLGVVEYYFEQEGGAWNSGWLKDVFIRVDTTNATEPPRYRVKMRDKYGNETAFSPFTSPAVPDRAAMVTITPDAPAVLEAEQCVASVPSLDETSKWEKQTRPEGFVGDGYMAVPDRGAVNEPFRATAAHLDYVVHFTEAGQYYLWVRASGNNDGGASIHAGFGLQAEQWGINPRTGFGRYTWTRSRPFRIDVPGTYSFSIWMRENGAMVDRFLFTADDRFEPDPNSRADDNALIGPGPEATAPRAARSTAVE